MQAQTITIKSGFEQIHSVERFVEQICDIYNIYNSYYSNILIAVTEAVENSIIHGNKQDYEKNVTITFEPREYGFAFIVEDEGDGFDINTIPDPTETDTEEGRGIFLIKHLSDNVLVNNGGKRIEMYFNIAGINQRVAYDRMSSLIAYSTEKRKSKIKNETSEK